MKYRRYNLKSFLHVYGQYDNHNPVYIVGSRDELLKLMTTINRALYYPSQDEFTPSDGECYNVHVINLDEPELDGTELPPPYYASSVSPPRGRFLNLWSLWRQVTNNLKGLKI